MNLRSSILIILACSLLLTGCVSSESRRATVGLPEVAFGEESGTDVEIFTFTRNGLGKRQVTNTTGQSREPAYNTPGTVIVFSSDRDGDRDIYTMNVDGSNVTQLTNVAGSDEWPSFSPDGTKIAFRSDRSGSDQIWVMNADGTNQVQLTTNGGIDPVYSPDGTKIAFINVGNGGLNDVFIMNADGTNVLNVTDSPGGDEYVPTWHENGTTIFFSNFVGAGAQIDRIETDGTGRATYQDDPALEEDFPVYDAATDTVFYTAGPNGGGDDKDIYKFNGTTRTRLTTNSGHNHRINVRPN